MVLIRVGIQREFQFHSFSDSRPLESGRCEFWGDWPGIISFHLVDVFYRSCAGSIRALGLCAQKRMRWCFANYSYISTYFTYCIYTYTYCVYYIYIYIYQNYSKFIHTHYVSCIMLDTAKCNHAIQRTLAAARLIGSHLQRSPQHPCCPPPHKG